ILPAGPEAQVDEATALGTERVRGRLRPRDLACTVWALAAKRPWHMFPPSPAAWHAMPILPVCQALRDTSSHVPRSVPTSLSQTRQSVMMAGAGRYCVWLVIPPSRVVLACVSMHERTH